MRPKVSIVIPVYNEGKYLGRTLTELRKQSIIDECELILAHYNPNGSGWHFKYMNGNDRWLAIDRKGIAYARHKGIEAAQGDVIVNFDADARYDHHDGLSYMTEPILAGKAVLTCCDNIFDLTDLTPAELDKMRAPISAANVLNLVQRHSPLACLEPGSAMSKTAYNAVGGYADIPQHELWNLCHRLVLNYKYNMIQHVPTTAVYMSARRAKLFSDLGLGVLDYSNKAFR